MEKIRILLAEDHVVVREGLKELIENEDDMEVVGEAGDGEQAVKMVDELKPDIVLMDIAMPKLNGVEATRKIKQSHPSVSILVLTAYDSEEFIVALVEAGAAGYLLKNVRGKEVLNGIRAVYAGESVLHPVIAGKIINHLLEERRRPVRVEKPDILTQRELEVLKLGVEGLDNGGIAARLSLGVRTVQTHWRNIFNKLGVSSRTEAIVYGLKKGWIALEGQGVKET